LFLARRADSADRQRPITAASARRRTNGASAAARRDGPIDRRVFSGDARSIMNLQPSQRRQDSPVRLGNHGYRLDGDVAFIDAELHIPPHCSGSEFALELWACSAPHSGGPLHGTRVAAIALELPTPITPHLHRVEARAASSLPSGNMAHAMVLMLVSGGDTRRVHDYANYERRQQFANPALEGDVGYRIEGEHAVLRAGAVANLRARGNSSGTLCLELWAFGERYAGGEPRGQRLAGAELGSVWGQYRLPELERRAPFTPPPCGHWYLSLLLREWTLAHGYATRDHCNFDVVYEQAAPDPAPVPSPPAAGPRPPEKLRLLTPADAPAAAKKPGRVSVNAASVDELAKLPGMSLKLAKEIVKRRPFTSLEALIEVRGVGDKTLRRIKSLLSL
jgi:competence ComEA-like helix-hairpin-helix protein